MILADYHCHCYFSSDSKSKPEDMVKMAISRGLKTLCFTDHLDYLYPSEIENDFIFNPKERQLELLQLKELYRDEIEILIGAELGLRNEPDIKSAVKTYYENITQEISYDFLIGSTHVLEKKDPYYKEYWEGKTIKDGITDYFLSIIHNSSFYDTFQVYGHLDYIIRYLPVEHKDYQYNEYSDLIDMALKSLLEHGKGIECNSAGLKYQLGFPHPKVEILKRYKELGGEILTIGSDAHKPEHIAYDFPVVKDLLESIGYRYYTVFKDQNPEFIKL